MEALASLKTNSDEHGSAFHIEGQEQKELRKGVSGTKSIVKVRDRVSPVVLRQVWGPQGSAASSLDSRQGPEVGVLGIATVVRRQIPYSPKRPLQCFRG